MSNIIMQDVTSGGYSASDWLDATKPIGVVTSDIDFQTAESGSYLFARRLGITEVHLPNASCISTSMFYYCSNLEKVLAPNAVFVDATAFSNCSKLQTAVFPKTKYVYSYAFRYCTNLKSADFGGTPESGQGLWRQSIFDGDTKFGTLVLRANAVWSLANISVFNNTPFASGKAGGTLYVPAAMISAYQAATNWSTILGYPNNRIEAIEGSIYETQYADGTTIPTGD